MNDAIGRTEPPGRAAYFLAGDPLARQGKPEPGRVEGSQGPATSQGARKIKRIAVEEHWTAPNVVAASGRKPPWFSDRQADLGEIRLGEMDAAGVTMQVIANSSYQFLTDPAKAIDLAKRNNEVLAEAIAKHPDRFAGLAALPTQDPKAAADELERAVTQLNFRGAMIEDLDHANWEFPDSPKFRALWERAAALDVPISLHPAPPSPDLFKLLDGHPELQGNAWAGTICNATLALRLIGSGILDDFPKIKLVIGHLGDTLAFWMGRLDEGPHYSSAVSPRLQRIGWKTKKPPSAYIRENIYVTTSGPYHPEALTCAIAALGADHVLFATDYAAREAKMAVELVERTPMSEIDREKIYHLNAERLFRL